MTHAPRLLAAALLLAPLPAAADTLYKCIDAQGFTTIQQEPCAKGATQVWKRDTAPEPPPTPEQLAAAQAREEARAQERARRAEAERLAYEAEAARAKQAAAPPPAEAPPPPPVDKCDDAKALAARLRGLPWLELNDGQKQRMFGWVAQQCSDDDDDDDDETQTP